MTELEIENNKGILTIKDEFNISEVTNIRNSFVEVITKADEVKVYLKGELKFDLSFLQLLYSAVKACQELGIDFSLFIKEKEKFNRIIKESGFTDLNKLEIHGE